MTLSVRGWFINNGIKLFFLVLWLAVCGILFWRTYCEFKYDPQYFYVHQMLGSWLCLARASAAVLNLNCGLLLLPMCRTIVTGIRTLQCKVSRGTVRQLLDTCKGFHIACGTVVCVLSGVHFIAHVFNAHNFSASFSTIYPAVNAASFRDQNPLLIVMATIPGVTGMVMMIVLYLMVTSSLKYTRVVNYDVFWYNHRLFIVFYILLVIHGLRGPVRRQTNVKRHTPGCRFHNMSIPWPEPESEPHYHSAESPRCNEEPVFDYVGCHSWIWVGGPMLIYLCDMAYRLLHRIPKVPVIGVQELPGDVIEIHMRKPDFCAQPGQYILIQCPAISSFEWHPYSFTMCPKTDDGGFTVQLRSAGDWSGDLKDYMIIYWRHLRRTVLIRNPEKTVLSAYTWTVHSTVR